MGFRIAPRRYRLVFTDEALNGLEVTAHSGTVDDFLRATGLTEDVAMGGVSLPDEVGLPLTLLQNVAQHIDEWNLEDDEGKPAPVSYETLKNLELFAARAIVKAWLEAVSGVSADLGKDSASGGTSPEAPPGLDSSSRSLQS